MSLEVSNSNSKIAEKSEKARREFFSKVDKIKKTIGSNIKLVNEIADQAASEYNRIFGRVGIHPLLGMKNGKRPIRYMLNRDEVWVLYKPPLWQMGGKDTQWEKKVKRLVEDSKNLTDAQRFILKSEEMHCVQEWHGLVQGTKWIDAAQPVSGWGFIQRLDVETDGPVVAAKTWRAQRCLQAQMREHVFSKGYLCLVHGFVENKIHTVIGRFAELGADSNNAVMLKYDEESDPFYNWSDKEHGKMKGRLIRHAETFLKPLAYYTHKQDGREYSLVYVNILTGITHQVRITMQSLGHPLVSDDRYLPKAQAMADLHWCPRNFLTEVRSDWFDFLGPFKDPKRKRYERISIENPLPKLFQQVLETKLTLVEKLDPTADLYVGPQYWALGDEQLMMAYPKDTEYRQKVMRWGQRKKIHLEALDRLLLLPKPEIDKILTGYRGPNHKDDDTWVCPVCMTYNKPDARFGRRGEECTGGAGFGQGCPGRRISDAEDENFKISKGYIDWLQDPTLHLLMIVNVQWLEQRRQILKNPRPSWEKLPPEVEGTPASPEVLKILQEELIRNLRQGGNGIHESDIAKIPGMPEKLKMPLSALPEDSNVQRVRLPAHGSHSQWTYTLKGKERVAFTENFAVKADKMLEPIEVVTEGLPERMLIGEMEKKRKKRKQEKEEEQKKEAEERAQAAKQAKEKRAEAKKEEEKKRKREEQEKVEALAEKKKSRWQKLESKSKPGNYYYFNSFTGESVVDEPVDFLEPGAIWERVESKTTPGAFYYFNRESGESSETKPENGIVLGEEQPAKKKKKLSETEMVIRWERIESKSNSGKFYYFNPIDGTNHVHPPTVKAPWKLMESTTNKGQFYYWNEQTSTHSIDPPTTARPAKEYPPGSSLAPRHNASANENSSANRGFAKPFAKDDEPLPPGWRKEVSATHRGKVYYVNTKNGVTVWERPKVWEKKSSSSHPGKFYYVNAITGETRWDKQDG